MRTSLSKWGNSLAFRVPKDMAEAAGFAEGSPLEMTLEGGALVIKPTRKKYDLTEMLKEIEGKEWPDFDFDDPPRGSEVW
jgi:antitoxin MazE